MNIKLFNTVFLVFVLVLCWSSTVQAQKMYPIDEGWSQNSVNAVIFRKNSLVTHQNIQYAAFYNPEGKVVLAKRDLDSSEWEVHTTRYSGNVKDAHNSISIMVDGEGYLHVAWDHHGNPLRYARSRTPGGLEPGDKMAMTGEDEEDVTYPEFYKFPDGNLLFLYRSGASGRGDLVVNKYDTQTGTWARVHNVLLSGENERNAYWQAFVDEGGNMHLSWVWRETWDVETNHDIGYAMSSDQGKTWFNSKGEKYELPITKKHEEVVAEIPQGSELINQTSMYADRQGRPYIATYWKNETDAAPQFRVVFHDGEKWKQTTVGERTLDFSLSGGGTKKIPVSRPQVMLKGHTLYVVYRDEERGNRATLSYADIRGGKVSGWTTLDLTEDDLGSWEPTYDTEAWKTRGELYLFIQRVGQGDGETLEEMPPQMVKVLKWKP